MNGYKRRNCFQRHWGALSLEPLEHRCLLATLAPSAAAFGAVVSLVAPRLVAGETTIIVHTEFGRVLSVDRPDVAAERAPVALVAAPDRTGDLGLTDRAYDVKNGPLGGADSFQITDVAPLALDRTWSADQALDPRAVDGVFASPREFRPDYAGQEATGDPNLGRTLIGHAPSVDAAALASTDSHPRADFLSGLLESPAEAALLAAVQVPTPDAPGSSGGAISPRAAVPVDGARAPVLLSSRQILGVTEADESSAAAPVDETVANDVEAAAATVGAPRDSPGLLSQVLATVAPGAVPIAGLLPVDLPTLARNVDRFFAKLSNLDKGGHDRRLGVEVALCTAAVAAGAYELVHIRAKRLACPSFADDGEVSSLIVPGNGDDE